MAIGQGASPAAACTYGAGTQASAAFSPPAGSLLVACLWGAEGTTATLGVSNSGTARTWSQRARRDEDDAGSNPGLAAIFTAPNPTSLTNTVVTATSSRTQGIGLKVYVITGAHASVPIGATGEGSITSSNATVNGYVSTGAASLGIACAAAGAEGAASSTDVESFAGDTFLQGMGITKAATTPVVGSTVTFNMSGPTEWNWAAIEILNASLDAEAPMTVVEIPATVPAPSVGAGAGADLATVTAPASLPTPDVSTGAGATPTTVAVPATVGAIQVTTENAEIVTPATIIAATLAPSPTVQTGSSLDLATVAASVAVPAVAVRSDASATIGLAIAAAIPSLAVQVPILPGDNMDGEPGQIEFNGTVLGRGTTYRWKNLQGWRTKPSIDSGNAPRPTRHGSWAGRPLLQERTILWEAQLRAPRDQVEAAVEALEQALPVEDDEREHPLVINDLGTPYLIFGRIDRHNLDSNVRLRLGLAPLVLQWICSDPRRYNINSTGVTIPINEDRDISNAGNIATHPLLRVHGPVDTPAILNETLDRLVSFDVTLLTGEQLLIDCDRGTATIDGADVMGNLTGSSVHPSDWVLARGTNTVSHTAAVDGLQVDVLYRDARS